MVFGAYPDALPGVYQFTKHIATVGTTRDWREIGARDVKEARAMILQRIFREWGIEATWASDRMRLEHIRFIGNPVVGLRGRLGRGVPDRGSFTTQSTLFAWEAADDYALCVGLICRVLRPRLSSYLCVFLLSKSSSPLSPSFRLPDSYSLSRLVFL